MRTLDEAVESLDKAISQLRIEAEEYYNASDNYRGNIRYDAANRLSIDRDHLIIARDYIKIALQK